MDEPPGILNGLVAVHKRISEEVNEIYETNSVHYESQRNIFSEWNR